jgi:protein SCO1/2
MRNRLLARGRSPIVHYGVLAILVIILFILGARLGTVLIENIRQTRSTENSTATTSSGVALVEPPTLVRDFTLTSQTGQPLSLSDLRGQPVVLFFGYTNCPEECPLTMVDFTRVKGELGEQGKNVHFVFISVDGERDTPSVVSEFVGRFNATMIGLTGDPDHLRQLGAQFGLMFERIVLGVDGAQQPASEQDENYFVSHISPSFLIDQNGYLNRVFFYGTEPGVIASSLRPFLEAN